MFLLRGPSYELALVWGLVGPFLASFWVALGGPRRPVLGSLRRGGLLSLGILGLAALGGAFSPACERSEGYALLFLGSGVGVVLAALCTEAVLQLRARAPRLARTPRWLVGLVVPLAPIAVGLYGLYASPAVFAYSEFLGYFAGPLYDRVEYRFVSLLSYRAISLLLALGVILLARTELRWRSAGGACLVIFLVLRLSGDRLGHQTSDETLDRVQDGVIRYGACSVTYARDRTSRAEVELLARECSVHLREVSDYFEVASPERVMVRLFANVEEKARWTGAGRTYVAKPWRDEVYVHAAGYPHPTLRHELAHVVAAKFGRGPFRIAGALAGLIPDPGRIEGFAVAAAPSESSDGSLAEWARAQLDLGAMPPLGRLFQFGFYGESSARAYGAAGAFVAFLRATYGAGTLRAWYAGADLERLTQNSLTDLERAFHRALELEQVPAVVRSASRARYSSPAVLERVCPHAVDRTLERAELSCSLDPDRAAREVEQASLWDPRAGRESLWLADCFVRADELERARKVLSIDAGDPAWTKEEKEERLADLDFQSGAPDRALRRYHRLLETAASSAASRALALKIWALTGAPGASRVLVRDTIAARAEPLAVLSLIAARRSEGGPEFLEEYLLGRAERALGRRQDAALSFRRARAFPAPTPALRDENERSLLISLCELREADEARALFQELELSRRTPMRRAELEGIMRRCLP